MNPTPILYESHMHTPLCKHAVGYPEEYAAVAQARGLRGIIVTCHNPTDDGWSPSVRMGVEQFDDYVAMVERARQTWAGRMDVRLGLESDYVPGMEAWLETLHARVPLNHVLGSVHPQLPDYRQRYFDGDTVNLQRTYFDHLAMAAESGLFDTLAHPDLVKNVAPSQWDLARVMDSLLESLDRIAAAGTAMELNTSGLQKAIPEMNPGRTILAEMRQRGIPVVLGADAHVPERVAANYLDALDLLQEVGYSHISLFLNRRRQDLAIDDVRSSLQPAPVAMVAQV